MLQPYAEALARLITIPGVDVVAAATIIAEIGTDMAVFTDAAHLAAWAGVCPGNHASARRAGLPFGDRRDPGAAAPYPSEYNL